MGFALAIVGTTGVLTFATLLKKSNQVKSGCHKNGSHCYFLPIGFQKIHRTKIRGGKF
jgi:hypothetical protein